MTPADPLDSTRRWATVVYLATSSTLAVTGFIVTTLLSLQVFFGASADAAPAGAGPSLCRGVAGAPLLVFLAPPVLHRLATVTTQFAASLAGMLALCCVVIGGGVSTIPADDRSSFPPVVNVDAFGDSLLRCAMPVSVAVATAAVHLAVRRHRGRSPLPAGWGPAPLDRRASRVDTGEILYR